MNERPLSGNGFVSGNVGLEGGTRQSSIKKRGGSVGLNSAWRKLSGSSAGCLPIWGIMQGGRSPTGMRPHIGGQIHAAIASGRLSKYI